jgi:hypothetical protein
VTYQDYYADRGDWEADAALYGNDGAAPYAALTPATEDYLTGHWTFADQDPPVYIVGKTYDVYAAAAEMCDEWAAKVKLHYNVTEQGLTQNREGKYRQLTDLAKLYRAKRRVKFVRLVRGDLNGRRSWGIRF